MQSQLLLALILLIITTTSYAQTYDPKMSKNALYFTKAAYCEVQNIENWDCHACKHIPNTIDAKVFQDQSDTGGQAYVAFSPSTNQIVISFRGSSNIANWLNDFDVALVDYDKCEGCKMHRGFKRSWEAVQDGIVKYYKQLRAKNNFAELMVTGHSLGGSLAVVAAYYLQEQGINVHNLYSFGTPRVGNDKLAEYGHKLLPNAFRIVSMSDPAPRFPATWLGYQNLPTEVWYDSKKNSEQYRVCTMPDATENQDCSNSVKWDDGNNHLSYMGLYTGCEDNADGTSEDDDFQNPPKQEKKSSRNFRGQFEEKFQ